MEENATCALSEGIEEVRITEDYYFSYLGKLGSDPNSIYIISYERCNGRNGRRYLDDSLAPICEMMRIEFNVKPRGEIARCDDGTILVLPSTSLTYGEGEYELKKQKPIDKNILTRLKSIDKNTLTYILNQLSPGAKNLLKKALEAEAA